MKDVFRLIGDYDAALESSPLEKGGCRRWGERFEHPESGIDPLVAMKIAGHTDCQTTANIYTHIKEAMLKKAAVDLDGAFRKRAGKA